MYTRERYPDADPDEALALDFTKNWHRHPSMREAIWYRGVNLGAMGEYQLLADALKIFMRRSGRHE